MQKRKVARVAGIRERERMCLKMGEVGVGERPERA